MNSMFLTALEDAFDAYYSKTHPGTNLNDPHTLSHYREELERFATFLVEEYEQTNQVVNFWDSRFSK